MIARMVSVPDVIGLPFAAAARLGDGVGLIVTGLGSDGRGVEPDSEASVVAQDPAAADLVDPGARLVLHVGGSAGDAEPRDPVPLEHVGQGSEPDARPLTDPDPGSDPQADPDLQPA